VENDLSLNLELEVLIKVEFRPKIGRFSFLKNYLNLELENLPFLKKNSKP